MARIAGVNIPDNKHAVIGYVDAGNTSHPTFSKNVFRFTERLAQAPDLIRN